MSVRKVYRVLVNGDSVFSGSFKSCNSVYEAFFRYKSFFPGHDDFDLSIACSPQLDLVSKEGDFLYV